jgi:hypothetical protein
MADVQGADGRSLEVVEGKSWGEVPPDATRLMATVYGLRRKPLGALSPEDLRVLIGQRVGVDVVVPFALAWLDRDPLVEGDFYPGDLLDAVLRVPASYWAAHPAERARVVAVVDRVGGADIDDELRSAVESFGRAG